MKAANNTDEFFDEELQSIGVKFTDETVPKQIPVMEPKPREGSGTERQSERKTYKAPDVACEPLPKYAPNWYDRLKGCVKWAVTFGGLCTLFFYWQQTGLMDPAAAVPSMCACTCLAGFGVGRHALK